uniref:Uncharacterized protein n=1 Tax=uncultured marine virus TaxID=186617 RepID=A0A0F7L7Y9_9VIRU|nr:hypothetical protein [uncultured marine virus]
MPASLMPVAKWKTVSKVDTPPPARRPSMVNRPTSATTRASRSGSGTRWCLLARAPSPMRMPRVSPPSASSSELRNQSTPQKLPRRAPLRLSAMKD